MNINLFFPNLFQVYKKALKKRVNLTDQSSPGEIINLQAVDAGMISMAIMFLNQSWSFPLQIIGSFVAVGIVLGTAALGIQNAAMTR